MFASKGASSQFISRIIRKAPRERTNSLSRSRVAVRSVEVTSRESSIDPAIPAGGISAVWNQLGTNLPAVAVYDMDHSPEDDVLVVGTLGRGAWLVPSLTDQIFPPVNYVESWSSYR